MRNASPDIAETPANADDVIDWRAVLERYWRWMRCVVLARVGDANVADDVMQEIALAVLRQPSRPTEAAKVAPWLYRVAVRHTVNHWRRNGRQAALRERVETEVQREASASRDWVLELDLKVSVGAALHRLDPIDRQVLLLKYTEGWSYRELAAHVGVTEKTIEHRLARARAAMRRHLRALRPGESEL